MTTTLLILGIFTAVSTCFSIYALIQASTYEKVRITGRDNEDAIETLKRHFNSSRRSHEARILKLESKGNSDGTTELLHELLNSRMGNGVQEETVDDNPELDDIF